MVTGRPGPLSTSERMMFGWLSWFGVLAVVVNVSMAWTPAPPVKQVFLAPAGATTYRSTAGARLVPASPSTSATLKESDRLDHSRRSIMGSLLSVSLTLRVAPPPSNAAPPVSVMMEEFGYFPVRDNSGEVVYVPARIRRESSPQAIELAKYMKKQNISMAGAYWCPHCRRQRELFGKEAWSIIPYQECAAQGYQHQNCPSQVSGYPTWLKGKRGEVIASGELALAVLAEKVGFEGFDDTLEQNVPPMTGASSCGK